MGQLLILSTLMTTTELKMHTCPAPARPNVGRRELCPTAAWAHSATVGAKFLDVRGLYFLGVVRQLGDDCD